MLNACVVQTLHSGIKSFRIRLPSSSELWPAAGHLTVSSPLDLAQAGDRFSNSERGFRTFALGSAPQQHGYRRDSLTSLRMALPEHYKDTAPSCPASTPSFPEDGGSCEVL